MKNFILLSLAVLALTGCPKEKEIKEMVNELKEQRIEAQSLIESNKFSTTELLNIHEYFFNFAEKVHMIKVDSDAVKDIQKMVGKVGVEKFCSDFVIPKELWSKVNEHCKDGDFYSCTDEMKEFPMVIEVFKKSLGEKLESNMNATKSCFN